MRRILPLLALIVCAAGVQAQEPQAYLSGKLLQMDAVPCDVYTNKNAKSGDTANSPQPGKDKTQAVICPEYVLQADEVILRIRPTNLKNATLLPIGEWAQFRFSADKILLRTGDPDGKEREYTVISMMPRGENSADTVRIRLNHLQ
jgi:hypothetical protein